MKGPTIKDIKVGFGLNALEVATFFAGLLVVIGLLMESGPEAWRAVIKRVCPHRDVTGNVLVTIGVFGEVAIGLFIARSAKRAELHANAQIAELNAETERLRKENNETALLREYRKLTERAAFVEAIHSFSGTTFIIEAVPGDTEVALFKAQLYGALREAGWIPRPWLSGENSAVKHFGVAVLTVITPDHDEESQAARSLAMQLHERQMAVLAGTTTHIVSAGVVVLQIGPRPETAEQLEIIRSEFERKTPGLPRRPKRRPPYTGMPTILLPDRSIHRRASSRSQRVAEWDGVVSPLFNKLLKSQRYR